MKQAKKNRIKEISQKLISQLKPEAKEYEIRDTKIPGFVVRVLPSGVMSYGLVYARHKRLTIGRTDKLDANQARVIAREKHAQFALGTDPIAEKKKIQTDNYLQFLHDVYRPWLAANIRTGKETFIGLKQAFPELHQLQLSQITPLIVEKWRQRRLKEGLKPASINRQLANLKSCLNRAVEWEALKEHPIKKVKPCKLDNAAKVRYLTSDEETALRLALDAREEDIKAGRDSGNQWREERGYKQIGDLRKQTFADHLKPIVLLALNCGLRRGEILKLKWADVHLDEKNLTVIAETAKGGKTRHVPLNSEVMAALKAWKKQQKVFNIAGYVFADTDGKPFHDVRTSWENVLNKAKITQFRFHDLRHHFASKLTMAGVSLSVVKELLGHSNYAMTLRYSHLAPEHKATAVEKLVAVR